MTTDLNVSHVVYSPVTILTAEPFHTLISCMNPMYDTKSIYAGTFISRYSQKVNIGSLTQELGLSPQLCMLTKFLTMFFSNEKYNHHRDLD